MFPKNCWEGTHPQKTYFWFGIEYHVLYVTSFHIWEATLLLEKYLSANFVKLYLLRILELNSKE